MNSGETKSFYCDPPLVGQYVFIRIPGNSKSLTICEVEVYSTRRTANNVKGNLINPRFYYIVMFCFSFAYSHSSTFTDC